MDLIEPYLTKQAHGLLKLGLRLAAESNDYVCGERHVGDALPYTLDLSSVLVVRVSPAHDIQHGVVAGLKRKIDVLTHLFQPGHGVDYVVAHVVGVRRQKPYALKLINTIHGRQKVAQVWRPRQVMAVGVHVLAQQRNLFDAPVGQQPGLPHDVFDGPADLSAPAVGDYAECAELVTAMDYRYVCRDARRCRQRTDAALRVDAHALTDDVQQRLVLLRAHEDVHIGEALLQGIRPGAYHAAHEGDHLVRVALLQRLEVCDHADDLVLGALPNDAAIKHDNVRLFGGILGRQPHLPQRALETFRVSLVHLATDSPDVIAPYL